MNTRTPLDDKLEKLAEAFAAEVSAMSEHPVLRGGVVQAALNEIIWALYDAFPEDDTAIADHLDVMGDVIRDRGREDWEKRKLAEAEQLVQAALASKPSDLFGDAPVAG